MIVLYIRTLCGTNNLVVIHYELLNIGLFSLHKGVSLNWMLQRLKARNINKFKSVKLRYKILSQMFEVILYCTAFRIKFPTH